MITWMQKHRKYLVVTIWISVIAFVGAGFVGWGAYSFSNKDTLVAEVGKKEVTINELQDEYSKIYSFYANMFGNNFNKEMADKLQLEQVAIKNLIDTTLILNLADEFGVLASDEEVTKKIISIESFQENGIFDRDKYIATLQGIGLKPKDFESSIKKEVLISKVTDIFDLNSTALELDAMNSAFYMQDRVFLEKIDANSFELDINETNIKEYWEKNKINYQTQTIYEVKMLEVALKDMNLSEDKMQEYYNLNKLNFKDNDGKVLSFEEARERVEKEAKLKEAKTEALKQYLELKKDRLQVQIIKISENDVSFNPNVLTGLRDLNVSETLKPIEVENGFLVLKLVNKILPKTMEYEEARSLAEVDLKNTMKTELLEKESKARMGNFEGEDLGFISRDDVSKLNLAEEEASGAMERIFSSIEPRGYILLNDKAILFRIVAQELSQEGDMKNFEFINQNLLSIKNELINSKILDILQKRYEIKLYYKNDKGN